MNFLGKTGSATIGWWGRYTYLAALLASVVTAAVNPRNWPGTVRNVLARQILFTGYEAVKLVSFIALLVGISVVVQAQLWLGRVGQSELLGPILVAVIIREAGPLLVNFVVIGRSGAAIAAELATMRVNDEVRVLDTQGLDPLLYLLMPRVLGVAISVFCLTIVFIVVSFCGGFLSGVLMGIKTGPPDVFFNHVLSAIKPADIWNLLAKTLIPGMLTGALCCWEGISVEGALTEIPQATTRGLVRSVAALFITSAVVSLITYV